MEMDSARRRRLLLMGLGVVLAIVAGWAAFMLGSGPGRDQVEPIPEQAVLVASRDIAARSTLTPEDFRVIDLPTVAVVPGAYTSVDDAVGRVNSVPVIAGQQITPNLFATAAADQPFRILDEDEEMVTDDSPFWRAVSIQVPSVRAVGGEVRSGQRVDLFVTVAFEQPVVQSVDPETGDPSYQRVDTAALVLNPETGEPEGLIGGSSTKVTIPDLLVLKADPASGMYILKVTLDQAEQINHINETSSDAFSLALRPEQDTRQVATETFGETTDSIIMRYFYRVPRLVDLDQLIGFPVPVAQPPAQPQQPEEPTESEPDDGEEEEEGEEEPQEP